MSFATLLLSVRHSAEVRKMLKLTTAPPTAGVLKQKLTIHVTEGYRHSKELSQVIESGQAASIHDEFSARCCLPGT